MSLARNSRGENGRGSGAENRHKYDDQKDAQVPTADKPDF
jgi:hypothetical protein